MLRIIYKIRKFYNCTNNYGRSVDQTITKHHLLVMNINYYEKSLTNF
jgi:hypothetical protein